MIAVPDFSAGAMENWGLVTYRETALLFKPGVSTLNNKKRIASVISHELAHQWFGNLVTPSWWTDLWLNEGFASYIEYLGVDAVHPEWKLLDRNMIAEVHRAMALDVLETSHPISVPVSHPDEIGEIFDTISYLKGASIIRMMDHFLGRETLRNGLKSYLIAL
jgi:aminopeptidase N